MIKSRFIRDNYPGTKKPNLADHIAKKGSRKSKVMKDSKIKELPKKDSPESKGMNESKDEIKKLQSKMNNLTNNLFELVNNDPIMLSGSLRTHAIIMANDIFNLNVILDEKGKIKEEKKNETKLPQIIDSKFGPSKKDEKSIIKEQYQTCKTYITSMVHIEYILHYSYLLEKYGNTLLNPANTPRNSTRSKTSKRKKGGKKSRTQCRKGGTNEDVKTYYNFVSFITGSFMTFKKGPLFRGNTYSANPQSVTYYHTTQDLDKARTEFYQEYDKAENEYKTKLEKYETNKAKPQKGLFNTLRQTMTSKPVKRKVKGSPYEKDLHTFWLSNRERYIAMEETTQGIINDTRDLDENQIEEFKWAIRMEHESLNDEIYKIQEKHNLVDLISQYYGRIISMKYNGCEEVDLLIRTIKTKIKASYAELIELLVKYKVAQGVQLNELEKNIKTSRALQDISTIQEGVEYKKGIDDKIFEQEEKLAREKLKTLLRESLGSIGPKINRYLNEKIKQGKNILNESTTEYRTLSQHKEINQNFKQMILSGSFLYLNQFGISPGKDIIGIGKSIQTTIPIIQSIVASFVDLNSITAESIDAYYIYLQIFMVAFATPILLQKIFGNSGLTASTAYNILVSVIQGLIILGTFIILSYKLDVVNTEYASYPTTNNIPTCKYNSSMSMFCSNQEYYTELLKYYFENIRVGGMNIGILAPTYSLHKVLRGSFGRTIIGCELGWLLHQSVTGMFANYTELGKQKEIIETETYNKLKDIAFNENYMKNIIDEFKESTLQPENNKLREGLIAALNELSTQQFQQSSLFLQAANTMAQVKLATIEESRHAKEEQKESSSNQVPQTLRSLKMNSNGEVDLR